VGNRKGSEKLKDVFGILLQLSGMVREGTKDHGGCSIPGNGPVAMGLYDFGWLATKIGRRQKCPTSCAVTLL